MLITETKPAPMTKERIEKMCRNAGMVPVDRRAANGIDVVVADGFAPRPEITFQKFNVDAKQFPLGCYGTFWWALRSDTEGFLIAYPLFFDALHNPGMRPEDKQRARVEAAFENADEFLTEYRDRLIDAIPRPN